MKQSVGRVLRKLRETLQGFCFGKDNMEARITRRIYMSEFSSFHPPPQKTAPGVNMCVQYVVSCFGLCILLHTQSSQD